MEVTEELKVERTWAEVIELRHPLADYFFAFLPVHYMAVIIEFVHGVPYGKYVSKVELSAETLLRLLEARKRRRGKEDVCIARRGNITYIYLPRRRYLAKFTGTELEYDIPDAYNYYRELYPVEDVENIETIKEMCK